MLQVTSSPPAGAPIKPSYSNDQGEICIQDFAESSRRAPSYEESQWCLQVLANSVLKVISPDQVVIVVMSPYTVHWITPQQQVFLGNSAGTVRDVTTALEPMLGGPNSELVAEHIARAAICAQMGAPMNSTIELRASAKSYRADFDCYFEDPDLHAIVALLTPLNDRMLPGYEKAQLSSIRYHVGVEDHEEAPQKEGSTSTGSQPQTPSSPESHVINDFIPSMAYREVDYFYSMLPRGHVHEGHGFDSRISAVNSGVGMGAVCETEKQFMDPDQLDPHMRMRLMQENFVQPVVPREPRRFADVQREIMNSRLLALQQASHSRQKTDTKCLECGIESSPEWRKGPLGPKTLCNRCGLRYAKKLRAQK